MTNVNSARDIARGTRVQPASAKTAETLANRKYYKPGVGTVTDTTKFLPEAGEIVGICGADCVLVRWDNGPDHEMTVHWANLRPEGGNPYWRGHPG